MKIVSLLVLALAAALASGWGCGGGDATNNVPAAPSNVSTAIGANSGELVISWDAVDGATSYNLYWSDATDVTTTTASTSTKAAGTLVENISSPFTHDGLTDGADYYYVLTAVGEAGESSASAEAYGVPKVVLTGTLDATFDADGKATSDSTTRNGGYGVALDSEGRIVVGGYIWDAVEGYNIAVWRYGADGLPDNSFGTAGLLTKHDAAGGANWEFGYDLAIDADGRILVAGYSDGSIGNNDMVIWRLNADGSDDTTFGTAGIVKYNRGVGGNCFGYGMTLDAAGNIMVTGICAGATTSDDMALWRFDTNGDLDNSFGSSGVVFDHNAAGGDSGDEGFAVAVDSQGRVAVVGKSQASGFISDLVVWRYDGSGVLDATFGGDGIALYDAGANDGGFAIAIDETDRILAVGSINDTVETSLGALLFGDDGNLDTSFDDNGLFKYTSGDRADGTSVAIGPRGGIFVSGMQQLTASDEELVIIKLDASGAPDTSFGTNGVTLYHDDSIPLSEDKPGDIAFDKAGRLIAAGVTGPDGTEDMAIWRFE